MASVLKIDKERDIGNEDGELGFDGAKWSCYELGTSFLSVQEGTGLNQAYFSA